MISLCKKGPHGRSYVSIAAAISKFAASEYERATKLLSCTGTASPALHTLHDIQMLAWMGGKRSKLKHAKNKLRSSSHTGTGLNDKQAAPAVSATRDKRKEQPSTAVARGNDNKKARTMVTTKDSTLAVRLATRSSGPSGYQEDALQLLSTDAAVDKVSGLLDIRGVVQTASLGPSHEATHEQMHQAHESQGNQHYEANNKTVTDSDCNIKRKPRKTAASLDLQAIELPK